MTVCWEKWLKKRWKERKEEEDQGQLSSFYSTFWLTRMAVRDTSNWRKWHSTWRHWCIDVLNLSKAAKQSVIHHHHCHHHHRRLITTTSFHHLFFKTFANMTSLWTVSKNLEVVMMYYCVWSTMESSVDTDTLRTWSTSSTPAQSSFLTWRSTSQRGSLIQALAIYFTSRIQALPNSMCSVI